jgi:hypothetical protein
MNMGPTGNSETSSVNSLCTSRKSPETRKQLISFQNASALRLGFASEKDKRRFLISNVFASKINVVGNTLPASYGLSGPMSISQPRNIFPNKIY